MQSRIEHYIDDFGLRRMMVRAHRQAWVWQDEWIDLTIEDIRRLERETQIILRKKLGKPISDDEADGDAEDSGSEEATLKRSTIKAATEGKPISTGNGDIVSSSEYTTKSLSHLETSPAVVLHAEQIKTQITTAETANTSHSTENLDPHESNTEHPVTLRHVHSCDAAEFVERRRKSGSLRYRSLKRNSRQGKRQASLPDNKIDPHVLSTSTIMSRRRLSSTDSEYLPCYGLDVVAMMNASSDDEYYDALGEFKTVKSIMFY